MGIKLGSLATGIAAGYMAMGAKKRKNAPAKLGEGDVAEGESARTGLQEPVDYEAGYEGGGYANGGLVGPSLNSSGDRHFGKKR